MEKLTQGKFYGKMEKRQCPPKQLLSMAMEVGNDSRGTEKYFILTINWQNNDGKH